MAQRLYRIGDAAELLSLKTYVLRYWETEFSQLRPVRTGKGQRRYTEADVAMLGRIRYLLHEQGLTIEGARRVLAGESALSLKDVPLAVTFSDVPEADRPAQAVPVSVVEAAAFPGFVPGTPTKPEIPVLHFPPVREKQLDKPIQLPLDACLADAKRREASARRNDGRNESIRWIADELRALLSLLRQS